jgi:hypothetical protein
MSLLLECRTWMEKAIERMTPDCDPNHQMEVHAALALSFMYTEGNSERVHEAFHTALNLAQRQEDAHLRLALLSGMSLYLHGIVDANSHFRAWPPQRKPDGQTMLPSLSRCLERRIVCAVTNGRRSYI